MCVEQRESSEAAVMPVLQNEELNYHFAAEGENIYRTYNVHECVLFLCVCVYVQSLKAA